MDLGDFGTFATLLLAVIALGAAAGVGFQRGKIGRLEKDLDRANGRADRAEQRVEKLEGDLHQCRSDLDALSRVVTNEAHVTAIGHQLDEHHEEAMKQWRKQDTVLEKVADGIAKLGDALRKVAEVVEAYRR